MPSHPFESIWTRRVRRALRSSVLVLALVVLAPTSWAQARDDGAPASALGLADAVRATPNGATGLYFNPAGLGWIRQYALEAGYVYLDDHEGHGLVASAVDSATNEWLGMGSSYTFIISSGEEERTGHQIRGGLSSGFRGEGFGFHVGVGVNYLTLDGVPKDQQGAATGIDSTEYFTLDAGLLLTIGDMFRVGVSAQNLIDTEQRSTGYVPAPRKIGVGAALNIDILQLSFDADLDIQNPAEKVWASYSVGGQVLIAGMIVARLGFQADTGVDLKVRGGDTNYLIAGGLGYVSREFGVDVGFRKSVVSDDGTIVSAMFKYFLP